ncbi:family 16 glycosylhydrolase, partial [Cardiobacterium hominis]
PPNPQPPQPQPNHAGTVSITGEAKVGGELTANISDADGVPDSGVTYQWQRDGQPIDQANGKTYTLTQDDAGHKITVRATYKDNAGHDESPLSSPLDIDSGTPNHSPTAITLNAGDSASYWVKAESGGATVGKLGVSDPDSGDTHTYTVSDSRFEITADGTLKLKDGQSVHYGEEKRIQLTVTATDNHGAAYSRDIAVQVKDEGNKGAASPLPAAPAHDPQAGITVPDAPNIARDDAQRGGITITPAHGADSLHLRYRDESGRTHDIDLVKHNDRWQASDSSLSVDPQSGVITLAPGQVQDGSTVMAGNAARGIHADRVATLTADSDSGRIGVPTLAHDPAHSGGITLTPAADNDSLSMAYTDNNGIARTLSAAKENGEWRITAAGTSASIDPASGTITLPPERILDNSTVRASGGQNGAQSAETTLRSGADTPPLEAYLFAAGDASVNEGDSAHYLIRLNRPAERDLTFNVRVSHKDTDAGDLDDRTQTVTIRAGESHATFHIDTRDDTNAEHIETYKVSITSADGGATVPDWKASLTGEIRDNDGTIAAPNVHEGTDGTTITPAAGAQHIHITYQDNQFGNVTLNAWRDDNNRWHLSEVNPDKRTTAPSIDPDSGSVTLPSSILAAGGRVHAHNNDSQNSGAGGRNSAVAEYDGWKLDWHDTFDKPVEESGWTRYGWDWQTPEHGGMGRYQQSNTYTADGVLNIQNQYHNGAWTSAGISSGNTFAASGGRWEIRAKFSDAKGIGYVFLLWPKSENWPPEVDFAEGRARDPNIMGTYHWGTAADHQQDNQYLRNADLTDWHTYGAIIDPDAGTITYTFDGKPWYTLKNVPATSEMMWLGMQTGSQDPNGSAAQSESIDNAIPGAHTPATSNIQIDWVAHYTPSASGNLEHHATPHQHHDSTGEQPAAQENRGDEDSAQPYHLAAAETPLHYPATAATDSSGEQHGSAGADTFAYLLDSHDSASWQNGHITDFDPQGGDRIVLTGDQLADARLEISQEANGQQHLNVTDREGHTRTIDISAQNGKTLTAEDILTHVEIHSAQHYDPSHHSVPPAPPLPQEDNSHIL